MQLAEARPASHDVVITYAKRIIQDTSSKIVAIIQGIPVPKDTSRSTIAAMPNSSILYFHYSNDKWQNTLLRFSFAEVEGGQVIEPLILPESLDINLK